MDKDTELQEAAIALKEEWGVTIPDLYSEEAILKMLEQRVIHLIETEPESFIPLMYRLDISEKKLNGVMNEADVAHKIARLIYDRQIQKIQSRRFYRSTDAANDPDLKW